VKVEDALEGSFITYNSYTGEIGLSDKVMSEPSISSFPLVEIISQDVLPEEMLDKVSKLK
jgi:hypothetical protein